MIMSECEVPVAFNRGSRSRASLPVVRSANQTKDRSLGVLYLQYGDETKQIWMPNKISTVDTVQALFVSAFPQLSMKILESPSTAIYVKDGMRNMYYELSDVRSITDQSCLKVYHRDPAHSFSHAPRPVNGDARIHKDAMYTSRDAPPIIRQTSNSSSKPKPTSHSVTALPSLIPLSPRSSGGGAMPRERLGHPMATPSHSASPFHSAILERRDVKPDVDVSTKYMGKGICSDPFLLHFHAAPSEKLDQEYHCTSYGISGMTMESTEHHSLFRQKSWKTSPHRMGELRITDNEASQCQGSLGIEKSSPNRQSFRKEGAVAMDKVRNTMGSPIISDLQDYRSSVTSSEPQTRSLKSGSPVHSISSTGASSPLLGNKISSVTPENNSIPTSSISVSPLQLNLLQFRRNISGLRLQLQEIKHLQLQNQEWVCAQVKIVKHKLKESLIEVLRQQDPAQRQRAVVEEERCKYLTMEEAVLMQLGDLEQYTGSLIKDSNSPTSMRPVILKEVEEVAVSLRKVGESLASIKGEFPVLQGRMRAVLRAEVEAVKFLKEEPHKLDSILKRVKLLTETLSTLQRCATEEVMEDAELVPSTNLYSTVNMLDPQTTPVSLEVILSQPLAPHCAKSAYLPSPELPTKQTSAKRHVDTCSSAQSVHTPSLNSSSGTAPSVVHLNASSSSGASSLEEIKSNSKGKDRAQSIEVPAKEWKEKRQSMCHYEGEFKTVLQEAKANMLRVIPSMEAAVETGIMPTRVALPSFTREEQIEKLKHFASTQEDKQTDKSSSEKIIKTRPEKVQKPQFENVAKASKVLGKPVKPNLSIKTNMGQLLKYQDKVTKTSHNCEKTNISPPPPPPRRNYVNSPGVIATRLGDVIHSSIKEGEIQIPKSVPQQKPRNSPDLKVKPSPLPDAASSVMQKEDEGDRIKANLQTNKHRSASLLSLKDQKNTETQENKGLVTDDNGNNTVRQNTGVIHYVTAQITQEPPNVTTAHKAASRSPLPQVSHVDSYEKSQNKLLLSSDDLSDIPGHGPDNIWSLSSDLPNTQLISSTMDLSPSIPTKGEIHVVKVPRLQLNIEETVVSSTAICTPVLLGGPNIIHSNVPTNHDESSSANKHVFSSPKTSESKYAEIDYESETFLNPELTGEEPPPPPPPDNIAFMITNTKVQALSTGEYEELVNAKKGNVQTVTVGSKPQSKHGSDGAENNIYNKKPVIIIFDEPMDLRLAYKRLSTIFECEEELERLLAEEKIDEENEETEDEDKRNEELQVVQDRDKSNSKTAHNRANPALTSPLSSDEGIVEAPNDSKQDARKKLKLKFPKKQLAALAQAIRTGTKTSKKTLQVVVYEDEEESDGTIKQHKETKRFEISGFKLNNFKSESAFQQLHGQTDKIQKSTYKTLDSLEQTIKQLETTISEMGPMSSDDLLPDKSSKMNSSLGAESSNKTPKKSLTSKSYISSKYPNHRKKLKPHLLPRPALITTTGESVSKTPQQNNDVVSPSSRMPVPMPAKTRQQGTSDRERATKQIKLQDSQMFYQANGKAKRSGRDPRSTLSLLPASKIPAFSSSAGKGTPHPDSTKPVIHSTFHASFSKSSFPNHHANLNTSSQVSPIFNSSPKLAQPTYNIKNLSLSTQTQNGKYSSSFSSHSFLSPTHYSPTNLSQVSKSIRTIHTPSLTSYNRTQSGSSGKSAIPTATSTKDLS